MKSVFCQVEMIHQCFRLPFPEVELLSFPLCISYFVSLHFSFFIIASCTYIMKQFLWSWKKASRRGGWFEVSYFERNLILRLKVGEVSWKDYKEMKYDF